MDNLSPVPSAENIQNNYQVVAVPDSPNAIGNIAQDQLMAKIMPLNAVHLDRLENLLFSPIKISTKENKLFEVFLEKIFTVVTNEFPFDCKRKTYLHGGEAGNILEYRESSRDIDTQYIVPTYTDKREILRIVGVIKKYFANQAEMPLKKFEEEKILKVVPYWESGAYKNRFYRLSFKDINKVKYDFSIIVELERNFLFYHDALKIPLNPILNKKVNKIIFPYSLLENENPLSYRQHRVLQTIRPETINFPGCIRLISNYVKGFVCKEKELERTVLLSIFNLLKTNPRNDLKNAIMHDIKDHHEDNYAAAVAFAFNFLVLLLRQEEYRYYHKVRDIFVEILNELTQEDLPGPLNVVRRVICVENGSLQSLAREFDGVSLSGRTDICSDLYQYKIGEVTLLFHKTEEKKCELEKGLSQSQSKKKRITYAQITEEYLHERHKWSPNTFVEDLNDFLWTCGKLKPDQHRKISSYIKDLLKALLRSDIQGVHCIPLCEHFTKHAFSKKLDGETKSLLLKRWQFWFSHDDKNQRLIGIYTAFISASTTELSLHSIEALLNHRLYERAKLLADKTPKSIPLEIRLRLIEEMENPASFEALELYITYRAQILKSNKLEFFKQRVRECVCTLVSQKLTPHRIDNLLKGGGIYEVVDSNFWSFLLLKALQVEKTIKGAIEVFFDKVVPLNLMGSRSADLHTCWNMILLKSSEFHDPRLIKLIINPNPILDLYQEESGGDLSPLLQILNKEAFRLLKSELLSEENYNGVFAYLFKYARSKEDTCDFLTAFLLSPNREFFMSACKVLENKAGTLGVEKLVELCALVEKRILDFPEENIPRLLNRISFAYCSYNTNFKRFNIVAAFARSCPSTLSLFSLVTDRWVPELLARGIDENNLWEHQQTIDVMIDLIHVTNNTVIIEKICQLLSFSPYLEKVPKESIQETWTNLISKVLNVSGEIGYTEEILKGLDFFYAHFSKVFGNVECEKKCIVEFVIALNCLFKNFLPLYLQQVDRFIDFLAEDSNVWKFTYIGVEQDLKDESANIDFIKNYFMFQRACGGASNDLIYTEFAQQAELNKSRLIKSEQWTRYSMGIAHLSDSLLRSIPVGKKHEEFILDFTYKAIEMLMNGNKIVPVNFRDEIQQNINYLIDKYISRTGYLSVDSFEIQIKHSAMLFRCSITLGYILCNSPAFIRYIFYLDKSLAKAKGTEIPLATYEREFSELIQLIIATGSAYHLYRICIVMEELKNILKKYSSSFRNEYKTLLRNAIKNIPAEFNDCDGVPIGKMLRKINL